MQRNERIFKSLVGTTKFSSTLLSIFIVRDVLCKRIVKALLILYVVTYLRGEIMQMIFWEK